MPVMLENDFVGMLLRGDMVIYLQTASARMRQETAAPAGGYSVDIISLMSRTDVLQPSESSGAAESVRGYTLRGLISSGDVPFKWVESKSDEQRGSIVACGQI
jgi:hypothetical protein